MENQNKKLRYGIMCNGHELDDWQGECLRHLAEWGKARPEVIIMRKEMRQKIGILTRIREKIGSGFLFRLWQRYFVKMQSNRKVRLEEFAGEATVHKMRIIKKGKFSEYFSDADVEKIREYNLDFMLRFGFGIIRGKILQAARYGVWSYHHGDERKYRGQPSVFREMYNNEPAIGGMLQRLTKRIDGGIILKRWSVKNNMVNWGENIDALRYAGAGLIRQVCIDILNGNADYFGAGESKTKAKMNSLPTNIEMCMFAGRILINRIRTFLSSIFLTEEWNIGLLKKDIREVVKEKDFSRVHWFRRKSNGSFIADPFGIYREEKLEVFFEEYDYKTGKGSIRRGVVGEDGRLKNVRKVLNTQSHCSYPYLIQDNGRIYAIPETGESGKVVLYEVDRQTGEFTNPKTIIEGVKVSDPTVFKHNGYWWLFGTIDEVRLYGWYSRELSEEWREHKNNPLKIDISSARPAGTPYVEDGQMFRPAQDCSRTYGGRIVVNKVLSLTPEEFSEEEFDVIELGRGNIYPLGPHTLASAGEVSLIDGKRWVFRPGVSLKKIMKKCATFI